MAFVNTLSDVGATPTPATIPKAASRASAAAPTFAATPARTAFFRWREQWSVGIEALDRDRRALAAILNHIALRFGEHGDAANTDNGPLVRHRQAPSALHYWLDALHERARAHFAREEALMRAAHYPDTAEHASEHALLLAEYTTLVRDIVSRGEERLRLGDLEALKQWFMGHVLDMDKRLGSYLRANGITTLRPRG
jgi:hemerythrin-like metal-binding protein